MIAASLGLNPEKLRIEQLHVRNIRRPGNVIRLCGLHRIFARCFEFRVAQRAHRFNTVSEIFPEFAGVPCAWNTKSHPDDCNIIQAGIG
jgi:hypothetical protein